MRYARVAQIKPHGNPHAACLDHVAEAFAEVVGAPLEIVSGMATVSDAVVIGAHLSKSITYQNCAIWNTEQVQRGSRWMNRPYLETLRANEVWDYDRNNVAAWENIAGIRARWVPLGYHPSMELPEILEGRTPLHVLFYGSAHPRRERIVRAVGAMRLPICYGAALDTELRRAKAVLNIHYYDVGIFEIVRCSYLFANAVPVVSETSRGEDVFWDVRMPVGTFYTYDHLTAAILAGDYPSGESQREAFMQIPLADAINDVNL